METLAIAATPEQLGAVHAALESFWSRLADSGTSLPEEAWRFQFESAVAEIAGNIVQHAYPARTKPGPLELSLCAYVDRVKAELRDEGIPFVDAPPTDKRTEADPLDINALDESGRGLMIAHAWVDELDHSLTPIGNRWRLVKRR